jgi:hypothetical protein
MTLILMMKKIIIMKKMKIKQTSKTQTYPQIHQIPPYKKPSNLMKILILSINKKKMINLLMSSPK